MSAVAVATAVGVASALAGASVPPAAIASPSQTYSYVGAPQIYVVPDGVTSIDVTLKGAEGLTVSGGGSGGEGATVNATISVSPGEVLQINVGGQGRDNASAYNGGGRPGGGGATDIRRPSFASTMTSFNSCAYNFSCGYPERIVIAGGGGGGGNLSGSNGGRGGENGEAGTAFNASGGDATGGAGGSQSAGGSAGGGTAIGPNAGPGSGSLGVGGANGWATGAFGGGGGGGLFGGGQGGQSSNGTGGNLGAGGGGGGSSYAGGAGVSSPLFTTGGGTGNGSVLVSVATAISNASFGYTGGTQTYTVAIGVTELAVRLNGGVGAAQGDVVYGRLPVSGGQILQVNIGGAAVPVSQFNGVFSGGAGGWNGGGNVVGATPLSTNGTTGGGGASDVRVSPYSLSDRVVVAGGGGGCYLHWCGNGWTIGGGGREVDGTGGNAFRNLGEGVFTGGSLSSGGVWMNNPPTPWTPNSSMPVQAGGSFGQGGSNDSGGGGGYYGGAGATASGGGSSYASVTGPDATMQGIGNVLGQAGAPFQHDRGGSSGDGIAVMTAMPSATTDPAQAITGTSASLSGTVRPRFLAAKPAVYFSTDQTTVNNGGGTIEYLTGPASATVLAGDSTQSVSGSLTGLSRGTTYYYRVCARSVAGNGCGETQSFSTDPRLVYNGNSPTSGSPPTSVDAASGASVAISANSGSLEKSGFLFNGWNTESNGSGVTYQPGASFSLSANTTLYARWTTTATISYQGNGATGGSAAASGTYSLGGPAYTVETNSFTRSGYSFAGWNTSANGTGAAFSPGASMTPSSDVILFAQWSANGNSSGGGVSAPSQSIPFAPSSVVLAPPLSPILVAPTISVGPGQAVALVNGQLQVVNVSAQGNSAQVSGPQWSIEVWAAPVSVQSAGGLTVQSGGVMQISGNGYTPDTQILVYVLGINQPIGTATVRADGTFTTSATIPANLVGNVVVQVNGYATTLTVRSVSLGVKLAGKKPIRAERIVMGSVMFDIFSSVLSPQAKKTLRSIARVIGSRPAKVSTIGYTQGVGVMPSALKLSKKRAEVVNEFLRDRGVRGAYLSQGMGNRGPKAADRTAVVTVRYSR